MRVIDETALHHVPAKQSLQPAEAEHQQVLQPFVTSNIATHREHDERYEEDDANQAAEQPVQIFEPEYILVVAHIHLRVYFLELRGLLV